MGTKNNPGKYDCHASAELDEPMFTLLARDPIAASLVMIWAQMRHGNIAGVSQIMQHLLANHVLRYVDKPDEEKAAEAEQCAMAMAKWREEHRP